MLCSFVLTQLPILGNWSFMPPPHSFSLSFIVVYCWHARFSSSVVFRFVQVCLRPSSALESVDVDASLGGGQLFCDKRSAAALKKAMGNGTGGGGGGAGGGGGGGLGDPAKRARIKALREVLRSSVDTVRASVPSLAPLLLRVRHGYVEEEVE